jgi:predicted ArsR family transcriptional regulator
MLAQTSLLAYRSITKKELSRQEKEVLHYLEEIAPATNRQVSKHSGLDINVVTARMNAMAKENKRAVTIAYIQKDVTGRSAKYWKPIGRTEYENE